MKVKVIKVNLPSYWYANNIGKEYDVVGIQLPNHKFEYKVVGSELVGTKYFDKDDVEIITEEKVMKKSDLRTGMRVVHGKHPRQEGFAIVLCDLNQFVLKDGGWNLITSYSEDLKNGGVWDITEVYAAPERDILNINIKGDLLWKLETKTPAQMELESLQMKISELQSQAQKLQGLISK